MFLLVRWFACALLLVGALPAQLVMTVTSGGLEASCGTIAVPVVGDTVAESDETFFVDLSNPSGATVTSSTASTSPATRSTA